MAQEIGEFETTLSSCLTDEEGSLIVSLRVAKGDTRAAKQVSRL